MAHRVPERSVSEYLNVMPVRYVPMWFIGAGWKRRAFNHLQKYLKTVHEPYDKVKHAVVSSS